MSATKRGDFELPPPDFAALDLSKVVEPLTGDFWRISHGMAPSIDWSLSDESRFSHSTHPHGGLYIADDKATCFWERFGQEISRQPPDARLIQKKLIDERVWKRVSILSPLYVLDLRKAKTTRAMKTDTAMSLAPYDFTQEWARQIMLHKNNVQGLIYTSRLNSPRHCVVLFNKPGVAAALSVTKSPPPPIDDAEVLQHLASELITLS